jgi:hypothetical protein
MVLANLQSNLDERTALIDALSQEIRSPLTAADRRAEAVKVRDGFIAQALLRAWGESR